MDKGISYCMTKYRVHLGRVLNFLARENSTSLTFSARLFYKFPEYPSTLPQDVDVERRYNKLVIFVCL
jgi:hypothetical protein